MADSPAGITPAAFSPVRAFITVLVTIFIAEISVMSGLSLLGVRDRLVESLLDGTILLMISYPVLYRFLFRPLSRQCAQLAENETTLRASQERLARILEASPQPMMLSSVGDWKCIDLNEAFTRITGFSAVEALGLTVEEMGMITAAERARLGAILDREGRVDGVEVTFSARDGATHYGILSVVIVSASEEGLAIATVTDITDRKLAEQALKKSEENYRSLMEVAADGIFITDSVGRFLDVNGSGCRLIGYPRSVILSMSISDIVRSDERERLPAWTGAIAAGERVCAEWEIRRSDGTWVSVEVNAAGLPEGRLVGIMREITDRKIMEEQLVKAKNGAIASSRAKTAFLAAMSHEIRTPMNGVIGMLDLALDTALSADQLEYLQNARVSADAMLSIINEVLDFSKIEAGRLELEDVPFYTCRVLDQALYPLQVKAREKGLEFSTRFNAAVPLVLRGDPGKLSQILLNLTGNAVKFTSRGSVSVAVDVVAEEEDFAVLQIKVSDTGIGIPADRLQSIFDPFVQVDSSMTRRYGGTGLGLSIASSLAEAMQGRLTVESEVGKGTTFAVTVRLARHAGDVPATAADRQPQQIRPPKKHAATPGASLRVLVVEDNEMNQRAIMGLLSRGGHLPQLVVNGLEAVRAAAEGDFDLVLMDVQMPELDGIEATRRIRVAEKKTGKRVPIVALTAHAFPEDRARCLDAGMDSFLAKPVASAELLDMLQSYQPKLVEAPPVLPASATAVYEPEVLQKRFGGDHEALVQAASEFVVAATSDLVRLTAALEGKDWSEIERIGGHLKGEAGGAGAVLLAEDAFRVQLAARKKDEIRPPLLLQRMEESLRLYEAVTRG